MFSSHLVCFKLVSFTGKCDIKEVSLLPQFLKSRAHVALKIVPLQAKLVVALDNPSHPSVKGSLWNEKFSLRCNQGVKSQSRRAQAWFGADRWSCANWVREEVGGRSKTAGKPQIKVPPGQPRNIVKHTIQFMCNICILCTGYGRISWLCVKMEWCSSENSVSLKYL